LLDANENAYGPGLDLEQLSDLANGYAGFKAADIDFLALNRYPDP